MSDDGPGHHDDSRAGTLKFAIVLAVALVMSALIALHVRGVNGPWYWFWTWRRLGGWTLFPAMAVAAAPIFAAQFFFARARGGRGVAISLLLLALGTFALQMTAIALQPHLPARSRLRSAVEDPFVTSYFTDAAAFHRQQSFDLKRFLTNYPQILPALHLHSRYKPPGWVLFYDLLINMVGLDAAPIVGGILIALLAAGAVPATFALVRSCNGGSSFAFAAASFLSLCPSLILFLPQFDQTYPLIACTLLITWHLALSHNDLRLAAIFGAMLALSLFLSYIFLTLVIFTGADTLFHVFRARRPSIARAALLAAVALAVIVLLNALLYAATGFNPIATYRAIAEAQQRDLITLARPFPLHILFDLIDFALASGYISIPLAAFAVIHFGRRLFSDDPAARLVLLSLLQIVTVALAALLPGEAARLWMFMLPLIAIPAGFELARWTIKRRTIALASLWLVMTIVAQNMVFVYVMRGLDEPGAGAPEMKDVPAGNGDKNAGVGGGGSVSAPTH